MDNWIDNLRRIGLKRYGDENRRILSELLRNGIPAGNTVMSEASAEALIIAVAAMIEENNKALLSDYNVDPKMTIEQMGHTNISCTQGHYFRNRKSLSTKTAILSSIPELQIAQKNNQNLCPDYLE